MKLILILVLSVQYVLTVKYDFVEYTRVAKTFDGKPCLTGCSPVDNECVVDWNWTKKSCRVFEPAPLFMTTGVREPNSKYCLSNCDFFGHPQEWCITSKDLKWDHCSSLKRLPHTSVPTTLLTIDTHTISGTNCKGPCGRCDCNSYLWCKAENKWNWDYCAPPALPRIPVLPVDFYVGKKEKGVCDTFLQFHSTGEVSHTCSTPKAELADDFLANLADGIEFTTGESDTVARVTKLNDPHNPIERYVTVNIGDTHVPAIVRAHVNKDTLPLQTNATKMPVEVERKIRQQMSGNTNAYVLENIIGVNIGGPNEYYNIAPMCPHLSCVWYDFWEAIRRWCRDTNGSVDILVVVFYTAVDNPVPKAFGISLTFRNADRSLFVDCRETIYWSQL